MPRRLLSAAIFALASLVAACTPAQLAGLKTANTIAAGVACGIAAANETPCTPQETLAQLADAQKEIVSLLAKEAAPATDPSVLAAILKSLEANAESQRALTEQVIKLAEKANATPAPTPPTTPGPGPSPPPAVPPPAPAAPDPPPQPAVPPPAAPVVSKPSTS